MGIPEHDRHEGFEAFVALSGPRLLRAATVLTAGDHGAAEDLVQQALVRVAQHWTRLQGPPEAYARATLLNLSTDRWRRSQARVQEIAGALPERVDLRAGEGIEAVELRLVLVELLASLPRRQRAVLVLRFFEDLPESRIADLLGMRPGTVKSTCARALATLKTALDDTTKETVR